METLDIVSSALNEEGNIENFYERLQSTMKVIPIDSWRLIICDNGSTDNTWKLICDLAKRYPNVKGLRMSKMFSLDQALTAGLERANADAVVMMASDLQDPPEVIQDLFSKWREGFPHVVVRITEREGVSKLRKFLTFRYYKISNWASEGQLPINVSDFRLMSKVVYEAVVAVKERHRFMRGIVASLGFPTAYIDIKRPARESGVSSTNYWYLITWSLRGILANSLKPIRFISISGFILSVISILCTFVMAGFWLYRGTPFAGFGTIVGILMTAFSLTLGILGILAEYIALIYGEVKARPQYIVWEEVGS